jgi:ribonuclease J
MKAMRDISSAGIAQDIAYTADRVPDGNNGYLLKVNSRGYLSRNFCCTGECNPELASFLAEHPGGKSARAWKFDGCGLTGLSEMELPFDVSSFSVNHSIYGALAYILKSGDGSVAYTGDFRAGDNAKQLSDFVREAKSSSTLIIEGTRTGREGDAEVTEGMVYDTCKATADDVKGLVIADFSARNFERLEAFKKIASETGRQLVITAKDAYGLFAIGCADGTCRTDGLLVYDEVKDKKSCKYETETLASECPVNYVTHREIKSNPDGYIVCFSLFDMKHLLDIEPDGGAYIYSSCEAFNEEQEIDFGKLMNWLDHFNIKPYGFGLAGGGLAFEKGYHASGHASKEELERVVDAIDPDVLIPVHTGNSGWFRERCESARLMKNGDTYLSP